MTTVNVQTTTIEKLPKGEYFRLVNKKGEVGKKTYTFEGYCRCERKYVGMYADDFCNGRSFKKGTVVTTDFEY